MGILKDKEGSILLISCYELGHQPATIALPLGFLRREGFHAESIDLSIEGFLPEKVEKARFTGIAVPMHTALRLGVRVAEEIRKTNPDCHISFYGLYASLNEDYLLGTVADSVIGGEFEQPLLELIKTIDAGSDTNIEHVSTKSKRSSPLLERISFPVPERRSLPSLDRYAKLEYKGEQRLVGYVEASRGCLHNCTHCPIPPVYKGRFFVVPREVVLEDIRNLVASGARHITFGDPDFLNGPGHSLRIVRSMHDEFPDLTFDFTVKVEHIIKGRDMFPELARLGCIFIVSALESFSDLVLSRLEKGHAREDIFEANRIVRDSGISLRPSFVAFTPWTTIDDYVEMLELIEEEKLIDQVDPVQYTIRLLVPPGSLLLAQPDVDRWIGQPVQDSFTYDWRHIDPRMDALQRSVSDLVEKAVGGNQDTASIFYQVRDLAGSIRGDRMRSSMSPFLSPFRARPPRLTESWFC